MKQSTENRTSMSLESVEDAIFWWLSRLLSGRGRKFKQRPTIAVVIITLFFLLLHYYLSCLQDPNNPVDMLEIEDDFACDYSFLHSLNGTADVNTLNIKAEEALVKWSTLEEGQAKVFGIKRRNKSFLTIGIPSIKRANGMSYLLDTMRSIVEHTSPRDKDMTIVVVFLADFDTEYNAEVIANISAIFMPYVNSGFIQVVQAARSFYPDLTNLKRNFGDPPDRIYWRSKQNIDFAFMFIYGRNLSDYYIQLEDDVKCASNFVPKIREFIIYTRRQWVILEFSELGFIGKLFKSSDLDKLAQYLITFYDEQPVDWLIRWYRMTLGQDHPILRKPTLFQHQGKISSRFYDGRNPNRLQDKFFLGQEWWRENETDFRDEPIQIDMESKNKPQVFMMDQLRPDYEEYKKNMSEDTWRDHPL